MQQFSELVAQSYSSLGAGWYEYVPLGVLPLERKVVYLTVTTSSTEQLGYWFLPTGVHHKVQTVTDWLREVQWKSLNGYGVDCTSWCKPIDSKGKQSLLFTDSLKQEA
jgi:hypothetical protein